MFTNNAKSFFNFRTGFGTIADPHMPTSYKETGKTHSSYSNTINAGTLIELMKKFPTSSLTEISYSNAGTRCGVIFGNGTGIPSASDRALFGDYLSSLTSKNVTVTVNHSANDVKQSTTAVYSITNTTSEDLTISEIGLLFEAESYYGTASYERCSLPYLFEHSVLDNPITIPPAGIGQVTYTIEMEYPTFQ